MPPGLVAPPLRQVERKWKYCLPKFQPFRYEALKAVKPQTLDPKFEHGPVKLPECPVLTLRGEDCSAVRPAEGREEGFQEGFPDGQGAVRSDQKKLWWHSTGSYPNYNPTYNQLTKSPAPSSTRGGASSAALWFLVLCLFHTYKP